jgi:hypothetical protein
MVFGTPVTFFFALAHRIHITRKYLEEMMASIRSSPDLRMTMDRYALGGFSRKILIPSLLYGAVSEARFTSIGLISAHDAAHFPTHLKKILAKDNIFQKMGLTWFIATFLGLLLRDYLKQDIAN